MKEHNPSAQIETAEKRAWETPTVEELDLTATEAGYIVSVSDGIIYSGGAYGV